MSAHTESGSATPTKPPREDSSKESLTDLIDRMDREAFRRALQQRDSRMVSSDVRRR